MEWLKTNFDGGRRISGIVYMFPINQIRLKGSSRRMIRLVQKLLGADCFNRILLVTSFWNDVEAGVASSREKSLLEAEDAWKPFVDGGATVERMGRDYARFTPILEQMARRDPAKMQIEVELSQGKRVDETTAAMSLNAERAEQERQLREAEAAVAEQTREGARIAAAVEQRREQLQQSRYRAEVERQRAEADRIKAQMDEQERRHQQSMRQKEAEIAKQRRRQERLREDIEREKIEARKQERFQLCSELENASKVQYRASNMLMSKVNFGIEAFRVVLSSGGYIQPVWGIMPEGSGIAGRSADGQPLPDYHSVMRDGLSIWCDFCLEPIGAKSSYGEYTQPLAVDRSLY